MAFTVSKVVYINNTIDEFLFMGETQSSLKISPGYDEDGKEFMKLAFFLKNGSSEVKIYDAIGVFSYVSNSGEILEPINFHDNQITDTEANGSFHKAFKEIRSLDRQNSISIKGSDISIDRASFGLAEVN
jgi:hypothetical protein